MAAESFRLPWWLKLVNPIMMTLVRLGVAPGPIHILSVPGRRSGVLRSTPVSPITVAGHRYISTVGDTQWVRNARAAGWGLLRRGRRSERITLVELPVEERAPILREFARQVPQGVGFYEQALGIAGDPESLAAAAPRCRVFRADGAPPAEEPIAAAQAADYGVDAPGGVRWSAIGASIMLLAGGGLALRGRRVGRWLLGGGVFWLLTPVAMLLSSKYGKLARRDRILDVVALRGDEQVLDIGTGHGLMAIGAAKRLTSGHAVGIDIWQQRDQADNSSANALRNVRAEGVGDRCTIQDGDARQIPFPDASFDVVLANFALHNLPRPEGWRQACQEIARVLKPGGRLFDNDMVFTTGFFVRALREAGLDADEGPLSWWTFPPSRLVTAVKPQRRY